ncbi:MAG: ARMT1-like domain-containing protein, partial [Candidatus Omnitrophica bacterium]|nr:ARMT1-like domain-containing protein [Candidatus Omnitrophota bacterium]
MNECPPYMGRILYKLVSKITGVKDPFKKIKMQSNRMALKLYPELKKKIRKSSDSLLTAVTLAIVGNIIDYGAKHSFDIDKETKAILNPDFDVHNTHRKAIFDYDAFKKALDNTDSVLYIADNAGEVVFDKVLIEEMNKKVIYVVRENPIINDALKEDAIICGIDKVARITSSGCDGPGVMLQYCNKKFLKLFNSAQMIISKGQGNFEALSNVKSRPIFFLFRVKCDVVGRHLGFQIGDIILKSNLR